MNSSKATKTTKSITALLLLLSTSCNALSLVSENAQLARGRLQEALSSVNAAKLTLSPELIIPEPTDPTVLLLQADAVSKLSSSLRTNAKANAAFVSGSVNAVKVFCMEQESARGNFPSPLPVIYCPSSNSASSDDDDQSEVLGEISSAGASGILYTILGGEEISSIEQITQDEQLSSAFQVALDNGMQLIPEVVLSKDVNTSLKSEEEMLSLIDALKDKCGGVDPVALIVTFGAYQSEEDTDDDTKAEEDASDDDDDDTEPVVYTPPPVTRALKKRIPILGSIRQAAGGGRIGSAVADLKTHGYTGAILRCECLPGFRMNPDLDFVGGFWAAAIGDLKSTKSKNFNFRSKVALERDVPMEWYNYQKDVMESGALGDMSAGEDPLDSDNGDYKGF
jgi:hypothetical protein